MRNLLLPIFLILSISSSLFGQVQSIPYTTTVTINSDIDIKIDVIDIAKTCHSWGYHYGEILKIKSSSRLNNSYNITFNVYVYSLLGTGDNSYAGSFNISNTSSVLDSVPVFNAGKEVAYPNRISCDSLSTDKIGLTKVRIDFWGTFAGTIYGDFTSTLPIELISFDATANQNQVDLSWMTGSEKDNDFFTIERTVDGIAYEEVARIEGQGNSSSKTSYEYTDARPLSGISYYRLKQTDYNGESEVFEVKSVNIERGELVSNVYPNPTAFNKTTVFIAQTNANVTVNVRNILGQILFSKEVDSKSHDVYEEIELTESGQIFVVEIVKDKDIIARHKVLKN